MIRFTKMQGIGNDFVMVDVIRDSGLPDDLPELARKVNDRHLGVGADGLILLERGDKAPFRMRMFNPDGSESEMCGNGIRCFASLLKEHGHLAGDSTDVETGAGILNVQLLPDGRVRTGMGEARITRGAIGMNGPADEQFVNVPVGDTYRGTAISMGNPHLVIFVDDASRVDLEVMGPKYENHELFPQRTNVHFAQVLEPGVIVQRTWERGAGATLACGTGACSVAVAGLLNDKTDPHVEVRLPGGSLEIEIGNNLDVWMTGPAEIVFTGTY